MGTTSQKLSYLQETKNKLKEKIEDLGETITNETTFREYTDKLGNIYNELPKVTQTGFEITLTNTKKGKMIIEPKGNTSQDGEPTPSNPIDIKVVIGNNTIKINDISKLLTLNNIELCKIGEYQDYIYKNNGNWYKKELIAKKVLSDIAGWTQGNPANRFVAETTNKGNTSVLPLCTHLIGGTLTSHNDIGGVAIQNLTTQIRFNCYVQAYANNVNGFKNWLSSAKPVIYYVLESPKDVQITDITLINQLEELNRVLIQGGDITIQTESNEDNAQLIITASALQG